MSFVSSMSTLLEKKEKELEFLQQHLNSLQSECSTKLPPIIFSPHHRTPKLKKNNFSADYSNFTPSQSNSSFDQVVIEEQSEKTKKMRNNEAKGYEKEALEEKYEKNKKIRNSQHIGNEEIFEKKERVKEIGRNSRFEDVDGVEEFEGREEKVKRAGGKREKKVDNDEESGFLSGKDEDLKEELKEKKKEVEQLVRDLEEKTKENEKLNNEMEKVNDLFDQLKEENDKIFNKQNEELKRTDSIIESQKNEISIQKKKEGEYIEKLQKISKENGDLNQKIEFLIKELNELNDKTQENLSEKNNEAIQKQMQEIQRLNEIVDQLKIEDKQKKLIINDLSQEVLNIKEEKKNLSESYKEVLEKVQDSITPDEFANLRLKYEANLVELEKLKSQNDFYKNQTQELEVRNSELQKVAENNQIIKDHIEREIEGENINNNKQILENVEKELIVSRKNEASLLNEVETHQVKNKKNLEYIDFLKKQIEVLISEKEKIVISNKEYLEELKTLFHMQKSKMYSDFGDLAKKAANDEMKVKQLEAFLDVVKQNVENPNGENPNTLEKKEIDEGCRIY